VCTKGEPGPTLWGRLPIVRLSGLAWRVTVDRPLRTSRGCDPTLQVPGPLDSSSMYPSVSFKPGSV